MQSRVLPIIVLTIGFALVGFGWQSFLLVQQDSLQRSTNLAVAAVKNRIAVQLTDQINALVRLAKRWEAQGGIERPLWESDASWFIRHKEGYQAIEWVDATYHVRWIVPLAGNEEALDLDLTFEGRRERALDVARDKKTVTMTKSIDLVQGGKGVLVYVPVYVDEQFNGFMLGVFRIKTLFDSILNDFEADFSISILEDGQEIYSRYGEQGATEWKTTDSFNLFEVEWQAVVWPSDARLPNRLSFFPLLLLISGIVITVLFAITVHLYLLSRIRLQHLHSVNTELKKVQNGLEETVESRTANLSRVNEYLDAIFYNLPVGVAIVEGPDFTIFRINRIVAELYGIAIESSYGKPLLEVLPGADRKIIPDLQKVLETGTPILGREFTHESPETGKTARLVDWIIPILDEGGSPRALVGVVGDVSELRATQDHLRQSQKMEALGTLSGGIAHDFNNILGIILGTAQLVRRGYQDGDADAKRLDKIVQACERAAKLVQQILTFSRISRKDQVLIDLVPVLEDSIEMLKEVLSADIAVEVKTPKHPLYVIADPNQISQVIVNLCTNAAHAMQSKGGVIKVALKEAEDYGDHSHVCLSIADTGVGFTADVGTRIFEPFYTSKDIGKGTGLGLAVVYTILSNHNGDIRVASEPGRGSTFSVYLPIAKGESENIVHQSQEPAEGDGKVLVVDDEDDLADTYKEYLELLGYEVTTAYSAEEALKLLKQEQPVFDLVLTDLAMPEMSGIELVRLLRNDHPQLPIVLMTGNASQFSEDEIESLNLNAILTKPVEMGDLSQVIKKALSIN